eukprot:2228414-Rhodomonas_salina.3
MPQQECHHRVRRDSKLLSVRAAVRVTPAGDSTARSTCVKACSSGSCYHWAMRKLRSLMMASDAPSKPGTHKSDTVTGCPCRNHL